MFTDLETYLKTPVQLNRQKKYILKHILIDTYHYKILFWLKKH